MSVHEIVWTFDQDRVTAKVICHAEPGANCRLEVDHPNCECWSWTIERDEQGPFHLFETEDDDGNDIEERHDMRDTAESPYGPTCNFQTWVNEGEIKELGFNQPIFEIGRTAIDPVWRGDYYEWQVSRDGLGA